MFVPPRAKPVDLFNFQGVRKRVHIAPGYSRDDERLQRTVNDDDREEIHSRDEYAELDSISEQFDAYVRPTVGQSRWIEERKSQRHEINRLGDLMDFYQHKPVLTEFEKRVYKRLTRQDRSMQTDDEPEQLGKTKKARAAIPKLRLPQPLAMERVEEFLAMNRWRLIDLFRTLDRVKSWNIAKDDFMRFISKEQLEITEAQADELLSCFCRDANVPMNYGKFARGRSSYKKSVRESKTPSSSDVPLDSDTSRSRSSNYLQLPSIDTAHHYPVRDSASSYSRNTTSSLAKNKMSPDLLLGRESPLSA